MRYILTLLGIISLYSFSAFGNAEQMECRVSAPVNQYGVFNVAYQDNLTALLVIQNEMLRWRAYLGCLEESGTANPEKIQDVRDYLDVLAHTESSLSSDLW